MAGSILHGTAVPNLRRSTAKIQDSVAQQLRIPGEKSTTQEGMGVALNEQSFNASVLHG